MYLGGSFSSGSLTETHGSEKVLRTKERLSQHDRFGACIGEGSVVHDSVVLEGAEIGPNCNIEGCLIGIGARIPEGSILMSKIVDHG